MANKKTTKKKSTTAGTARKRSGSRKSIAATQKSISATIKKAVQRSSHAKSPNVIINEAVKVAGEVLAGAVQVAAEMGSRATGIGQTSKSTSRKSRAATQG